MGLVLGVIEGAGHFLTARTTAAAGAANMNCTLIVPANPLTARGLATPYQLTATNPANGPCNEANPNQTAFVQGAVINPATGKISIYNPLVIDAGTEPAVAPTVPAIPAGAVVAVWFGFNGNTLSFAGADQAGGGTTTATPTATATATASPSPSPTSTGRRWYWWPPHHFHWPRPRRWPHPKPWPWRYRDRDQHSSGAAATSTATAAAASTATGGGTGGGTAMTLADGPAASGTPDQILQGAHCIAGQVIGGQFSSFTQVGACNAVAFFKAANAAIAAGKLKVPSPGIARDGQSCPTTRSFALIDQDQSDNVATEYLASANGQIAQDTTANQQNLAGSTTLFNGSDNGLLDFFVDPALGCSPWTAPNLANNGAPAPALPLDELQAAAFAGKHGGGPAAIVPLNDPMTLDNNGNFSTAKADTYRSIVDQKPLPAGENPGLYCFDMEQIQGTRIQQDVNLLTGSPSPLPAMADNLFTFLAMRLQQSFTNLNCQNFGLINDVSTTVDGNGVVVAACFAQQVNQVTAGTGNPTFGMKVCPATTASASASPSSAGTASATATSPPTTASASATTSASAAATSPPATASATATASPAGVTSPSTSASPQSGG
jgi:hypothetical protein